MTVIEGMYTDTKAEGHREHHRQRGGREITKENEGTRNKAHGGRGAGVIKTSSDLNLRKSLMPLQVMIILEAEGGSVAADTQGKAADDLLLVREKNVQAVESGDEKVRVIYVSLNSGMARRESMDLRAYLHPWGFQIPHQFH